MEQSKSEPMTHPLSKSIPREVDLSAHLTFTGEGKEIALEAEGKEITISLRHTPLGQLFRELRALHRLHLLERLWQLSSAGGWLIYLQYGPFRFRVSRPVLWRLLVRLAALFNRPFNGASSTAAGR